ncbi:MAG: LuxR C-terminal-related transcriptional regulator [Gemmatimonadota bacterium]|nr:LuxR C-terminal-related transcriptional regulator [Gemmatimonadota bacterium]
MPRRARRSEGTATADLGTAYDLLAKGAWDRAAAALELVVADPSSDEVAAEAWAGIGLASFWQDRPERAVEAFERAQALYEGLDRPGDAARVAMWLSDVHLTFFGAAAVANGLLGRAERLLREAPPGPAHAWWPLYRGHYRLMVDREAEEAADLARLALDRARELSLADVETVARSLEGLALVTLGDVDAGMSRLDEASARAIGGDVLDVSAVAWACCYLIAACDDVRDIERAAAWCRRVMSFCERWGVQPVFLSCRTRYASILTWQGRWEAAERELEGALSEAERVSPPLERAGAARLGELRRRQGDLDAAENAFRRAGEHPLALLGQAAVALDRGDPELAYELATRLLRRSTDTDATARADALLLQTRAAFDLDRTETVADAVDELERRAERAGTSPLRATAAFARGLLCRARREREEALAALEEAVSLYDAGGAPFEAGEARIELGRTLLELGRERAGRRELELAGEAFAELGARGRASAVHELLQTTGSKAGEELGLTGRELEVLELVAEGLTNAEIADRLGISPHTVKRHISNILVRLGESSRAAAVARATRAGVL